MLDESPLRRGTPVPIAVYTLVRDGIVFAVAQYPDPPFLEACPLSDVHQIILFSLMNGAFTLTLDEFKAMKNDADARLKGRND